MNKTETTVFLIPVLLIFLVFIVPILTPGLIVGGDWTFPYSNAQLFQYAKDGFEMWSHRLIPIGWQVPHQNMYLFQLLAGIFALAGFSGQIFQKLTLSVILILCYVSMYFLARRILKNPIASAISGSLYIFSPIVFNYVNMGWIFVLLMMALFPFIIIESDKYFSDGKLKNVIIVGLLSSIAFFQSQAVFWIPITITVLGLSKLNKKNVLNIFKKTFFLVIFSVISIGIINIPWLIPSLMHREAYITASTSQFDVGRFSSHTSLYDQLRGLGSLFNSQFELSVRDQYAIFLYVPILLSLLSLIAYRKRFSEWKTFSVFIMLVAPFCYVFRFTIASLPLSNIVRDVSRFMVLSNIGIPILIGILFTEMGSKFYKGTIILLLIMTVHPYWLGNLYTPTKLLYGASSKGIDQRLRLLSIPEKENEKLIKKYSNARNVFIPTGGFVSATSDPRFIGSYTEIGDVDAQFSPFGTGIYISDKSNSYQSRFADMYLKAAINEKQKFLTLSKIFGIDNIFVRKGLVSAYDNRLDYLWTAQKCDNIANMSSDWSIRRICSIKDPRPEIYIAKKIDPDNGEEFSQALNSDYFSDNNNITYKCVLGDNKHCIDEGLSHPKIKFIKISSDKYMVDIPATKNGYIIVLNESFHPGWKISDVSGERLINLKLEVNGFVNGWYLPRSQPARTIMINFEPEDIFKGLLLIPTIFYAASLIYLLKHIHG